MERRGGVVARLDAAQLFDPTHSTPASETERLDDMGQDTFDLPA